MEMPEVNRCFGTFPPKYACFLIALCGLGIGGVGIASVVLYGLLEDTIMTQLVKPPQIDAGLKKVVLSSIGLTSLILLIANSFLLIGSMCRSLGSVVAAKWIIFCLCLLLLMVGMAAPISCFFIDATCFVKKISVPVVIIAYLGMALFVSLWLYFMVIAYNYEQQL